MNGHGTQILVALIDNLFGDIGALSSPLDFLCLLALGTPQTHEVPLQEHECQQGVDQHGWHRVEHEGGEVHLFGGVLETSLVDALEGKIGGSSDDGSTATQRGGVGNAQIVAQSDLGGVWWPTKI